MWLRILFIGLAVSLPILLWAQQDTVGNALISDRLDADQLEHIYKLARKYPEGGQVAVALVRGDSVTYYGAVRKGGEVAATDNHNKAFSIGSITKVFTATALADAVVEGKVSLQDSVGGAFDFPLAGGDFTYQQLATHTSGLPKLPSNLPVTFFDPYATYAPDSLKRYLREEMQLAGNDMVYSNLGFGILGYVLSRGAGAYAELMQRHFDRLGMSQTSVGVDSVKAKIVTGYGADGSTPQVWRFTDAMAGAGSIFSTPEDMSRFVRAQFTDDAALALTQKPHFELGERRAVGLGWQMISPEAGRWIHWHNGATAGYRSFAGVDVKNQLGVVVLTNVLLMGEEVDATGMQLLRSLSF